MEPDRNEYIQACIDDILEIAAVDLEQVKVIKAYTAKLLYNLQTKTAEPMEQATAAVNQENGEA